MLFAGLSKGPWGWGPSWASVGTRSSAGLLPGTWLPQPPSSRQGLGGLSPLHRPAQAASQASLTPRARIKAAGVGGDLEKLPHRGPVPATSSPRSYHRQGPLQSLVCFRPAFLFSLFPFFSLSSFFCRLPSSFPFLLTPLLLFHFFQSNFTRMHSLESTSFTRLVTKNNNPRPSSLTASFPRGSVVTAETHDSAAYLSVSKCHVCRTSSGLRGVIVTYSLPTRQEESSVLYLPCQARARTHSTPVLNIQLLCYFA